MSFGKLNCFIRLLQREPMLDAEGFASAGESLVASVRAYREDRHGTERWANLATFANASALFRFRAIPGVKVTPALVLETDGERFEILSVEDVRGRRRYTEILTRRVMPSG